jgi:arylsulfatase A-like enzyme
MTHMDHGMGQILEALADEGIHEETLVIYFSDNGGQEDWGAPDTYYNGKFEPHDQLGDNRPLRGWKGDVYEGGIRVPAVLSWPGRLKAQQVSDVITVQDLYPTIAHLIGASVPRSMEIEGVNIWPSITGQGSVPERILYWRREEQIAVRKGPWKLIVHGQYIESGKRELFHIEEDPMEKNNQSGFHPKIVRELLDELKRQISKDQPIINED